MLSLCVWKSWQQTCVCVRKHSQVNEWPAGPEIWTQICLNFKGPLSLSPYCHRKHVGTDYLLHFKWVQLLNFYVLRHHFPWIWNSWKLGCWFLWFWVSAGAQAGPEQAKPSWPAGVWTATSAVGPVVSLTARGSLLYITRWTPLS